MQTCRPCLQPRSTPRCTRHGYACGDVVGVAAGADRVGGRTSVSRGAPVSPPRRRRHRRAPPGSPSPSGRIPQSPVTRIRRRPCQRDIRRRGRPPRRSHGSDIDVFGPFPEKAATVMATSSRSARDRRERRPALSGPDSLRIPHLARGTCVCGATSGDEHRASWKTPARTVPRPAESVGETVRPCASARGADAAVFRRAAKRALRFGEPACCGNSRSYAARENVLKRGQCPRRVGNPLAALAPRLPPPSSIRKRGGQAWSCAFSLGKGRSGTSPRGSRSASRSRTPPCRRRGCRPASPRSCGSASATSWRWRAPPTCSSRPPMPGRSSSSWSGGGTPSDWSCTATPA